MTYRRPWSMRGLRGTRCKPIDVAAAVRLRRLVRVPADVTTSDWHYGLNVELEHADLTKCNTYQTALIAAAHLRERPDYYLLLRKYVER